MAIPAKFDVDGNGGPSYSVPIAVPPGTAGMTPALSLEYGVTGNGIVGVGWSLGGFPSIVRCPQTVAQDGVHGGITYTASDRFCLDGQRLMAISGTYGADGSEYRTEIESFNRVLAHGTTGTGPSWFEVHTKSGQVMEFGNTTDSRILAVGNATARAWALDKVSDSKGNYYSITYTQDATNGQTYPTQIAYTGNAAAGLTPYNSIKFLYNTARPDPTTVYQGGSVIKTTVLLTEIQALNGASVVTDYKLTYAQGNETKRSRLTSISVCDGSGATCLPSTTFTWTDGVSTTFTSTSISLPYTTSIPSFGDFNGDGKTDILWCNTVANGGCTIWLSNGDGTFQTASITAPTTVSPPLIGDFNGDGKSDILWCISGPAKYGGAQHGTYSCVTAQIWFSNGDGTFTSVTTTPTPPAGFIEPDGNLWIESNWYPFVADFNGDGRTDILWCDWQGVTGAGITGLCASPSIIWLSNGDASFAQISGVATPTAALPLVADFNGDGLADILWCPSATRCGVYNSSTGSPMLLPLWLSKGDGTFTASSAMSPNSPCTFTHTQYASYYTCAYYQPFVVDHNGDSNTDIFWCQVVNNFGTCQQPDVLWTAKADGTFVETDNISPPSSSTGVTFGDFNGDGRTDVLWCALSTYGYCNGGGTLTMWLSNGDTTFTSLTLPAPSTSSTPLAADFTGDGRSDILWCAVNTSGQCQSGSTVWIWTGAGSSAAALSDLLTGITNGVGATTTITYKALSQNGAPYTKGTGATYPIVDLQGASYVVTRVDASNGIGGTYSETYQYNQQRVDLSGRGLLGFGQMSTTDPQTGVVATTNNNQAFPYTGLVASETKTLAAQTLNSTVNTYGATNLGGTRNFVSLQQRVDSSFDLDGSVVPPVTTTYQYDGYGNATQVVVSTPDGASKTTTNTYTNDVTNWFLGRLTNATVSSTVP